MNKNNEKVKKFLSYVSERPELAGEIKSWVKSPAETTPEDMKAIQGKLIALARKHGFELTEDDVNFDNMKNVELDDKELAAVSGGVHLCIAVGLAPYYKEPAKEPAAVSGGGNFCMVIGV